MQRLDAQMTDAPASQWTCATHVITPHHISHHVPLNNGAPISFTDAFRAMREDEAFRNLLSSQLTASPFTGFRWETPPVSVSTVSRQFEFVLVNDPNLERSPDADSFGEHFTRAGGKSIVVFPSLGKDALLITPCPLAEPATYVHLGSFIRRAPAKQVHEMWQTVGAEMPKALRDAPLWLSTAGMGVAWLHVRIDQRPKYYSYNKFRLDENGPHSGVTSGRGRQQEKVYSKK